MSFTNKIRQDNALLLPQWRHLQCYSSEVDSMKIEHQYKE